MAALDAVTAAASDWNAAANGAVWTIASFETNLFIGGDFSSISGLPRTGAAVLNPLGSADGSWNPPLHGRVLSIIPQTNQIIAAGLFTNFVSETSILPMPNLAFFGPSGFSALKVAERNHTLEMHFQHNVGEMYEIETSATLSDWQSISTNRNSNAFALPILVSETNRATFFRLKVPSGD